MTNLIDRMADSARSRITARTAAVFAQPGHETIACGAQLARFDDLQFVLVTDGVSCSRETLLRRGYSSVSAFARARLGEFEDALAAGGVASPRAARLGFMEDSLMDQVAPLTERLMPMLSDVDAIMTYGYQGTHSDNDAVALAVHAVCDRIEESGAERPRVIETMAPSALPSVWVSPWVTPTGGGHELIRPLSAEERALKRAMVNCLASEQPALENLDLTEERFRIDRRRVQRDAPGERGDWLNLAWSASGFVERRDGSRRMDDAMSVMRDIAAATRGPKPATATTIDLSALRR